MNNLPKSWTVAKLGDVLSLSSQKYNPSGKEEYYVGLEHIEKGTGQISLDAKIVKIDTIKNVFFKGQLLYGKLRPYLNKVAVACYNASDVN